VNSARGNRRQFLVGQLVDGADRIVALLDPDALPAGVATAPRLFQDASLAAQECRSGGAGPMIETEDGKDVAAPKPGVAWDTVWGIFGLLFLTGAALFGVVAAFHWSGGYILYIVLPCMLVFGTLFLAIQLVTWLWGRLEFPALVIWLVAAVTVASAWMLRHVLWMFVD
jgi:hypothetical protein